MSHPGRKRLRALLRDASIAFAVSLALLLAIEVLLRLAWPQVLRGHALSGGQFSRRDTSLGMSYVPGAAWRFQHPEYTVDYTINADGFRDANVRSPTKPAGTIRVLLLGDSFTFGYGVDYQNIWPVLAERELRRSGYSMDLVKAGIEGMDTRSELVLLRRLLKRYQPDAVVVGFLINDLYSNRPYPDTVSGPQPPGRRRSLASRLPTLHLLILARRLVTASDAGYSLLYMAAPQRGEYLRVPLSSVAERQRRITEDLLRQLDWVCDSAGIPLSVLSIPQQFQALYGRSPHGDESVDVRFYDRQFDLLAAERILPGCPPSTRSWPHRPRKSCSIDWTAISQRPGTASWPACSFRTWRPASSADFPGHDLCMRRFPAG